MWLMRHLWYLYYLPMLFISLLSVFVSLSLGKPDNFCLPKWTKFLYIPTAVLLMLVLTNDLHQLVFVFPKDSVIWGNDYHYAFGYFLVIGYIVVCIITTLITMLIKCRIPHSRNVLMMPFIPTALAVFYSVLYVFHVSWLRTIAGDVTVVLCLLITAVLESCIQCGLIQFGCGADGIWAEKGDRLTVTKTDIYECTSSIFSLVDTGEAVFDRCRFYDNDGMFFLWGETEVLVRDTEIFQNRNPLLEGYPEDVRITFRDCTFRDNPDMGAPEDWSCAAFVDCSLPSAPVSAGTAYDELIQRYRQIVADPYGSSANGAGERCVLAAAQDMLEWGEDPSAALGYVVQDLSGDGVPELVIGFLPDHSILQYAVYTLADGSPKLVLGDENGSLAYVGNGSFHYVTTLQMGMGQGTIFLSQDDTRFLWNDFYFTLDDVFGDSAITIYHNTTGSLDPAESELTDWTMEYFYAWEPKYENLPMIPFSAAD